MTRQSQLQDYVDRYFLPLPDFTAMSGLSDGAVAALIAAGALPGPIYSIWPNGAFSSPIGGAHGPQPQGSAKNYYAPGALWWARRAGLSGKSAAETEQGFRAEFLATFVDTLRGELLGRLGYPQAYDAERLDESKAIKAAEAEWADWINGGYGVCLRYWDAHHAITKTCQRGLILALTEEGHATSLPAETLDRVLIAMQALEAVMLPFAPHQRPHGTPGLWIDRLLEQYGLGAGQR